MGTAASPTPAAEGPGQRVVLVAIDGAGPVAPAFTWLECVLEGADLIRAWDLTAPNFRLALGQAWVADGLPLLGVQVERDGARRMADEICREGASSDLWEPFSRWVLVALRHHWANVDLKTWVACERTVPVALDHELVVLVETDGQHVARPDAPTLSLLMHRTEGRWLVAGTRPPSQ